jgi:hypothetical protein
MHREPFVLVLSFWELDREPEIPRALESVTAILGGGAGRRSLKWLLHTF